MEKEKYLFRRQFILGPRFIGSLPGWKQVRVNEQLFLTIHPDLETSKVSSNNDFIVLLGFILDPFNPSFDNLRIIQNIIGRASTADDVFDLVAPKGGRFVLIVKINNDLRIFSDPAGFRHIFYYEEDSNSIWCASESSGLAEQFGLDVNKDAREDLFRLPLFTDTTEYWIPGTITLFKGIFHLIPNHYLDLNTGEVIRYWPQKQLKPISLQECIVESSEILQGLIESACIRFDLALAITAGLDTRALFAASKGVKEKIHFFTHTHSTLSTEGPDIAIPRAMLRHFGVNHHIVYQPEKMSEEFEVLFRRNVTAARTGKGLNAYAIDQYFNNIKKEMLVANGVCSEIARNFYPLPNFFRVNGKALATLVSMTGSKIAEEQFNNWLQSAQKVTHLGIRILELFYWENRNAKWPAYNEYDIIFDSYSPFNCRALLEKMIGVDRKYRLPPDFILHKELIRNMWPEVLQFPINPPISKKEAIINLISRTKFYDILRLLKFFYHYYSKW